MYNYLYKKTKCTSKWVGKSLRIMICFLAIAMIAMGVGNADAINFFAAGTALSAIVQVVVALVLDD